MTVAGAPQPGATALRDLSMPGAAQHAQSFAEQAAAADRYVEPGLARDEAFILCPVVGPPAPSTPRGP